MSKTSAITLAGTVSLLASVAVGQSAGFAGIDEAAASVTSNQVASVADHPAASIAATSIASGIARPGRLTAQPAEFHPTQILVRFEPGASRAVRQATHDRAQSVGVLKEYRAVPDLVLIEVAAGRVDEALEVYRKDPNVLYAEPDYIVHVLDTPNDPDFGLLWGLHNTGQVVNGDPGTPGADIRAVDAWSIYTGDPDFRIAVIDTGINYNHPDLQGNVWTNEAELNGQVGVDDDGNGYVDDIHGYDFLNNDGDPMDDHYHGSHVAGTIGAVGNDGQGVVGVNWRCRIVGLKFLSSTGSGPISAAVEAMEYVIANDIRVSNNSWGCLGWFGDGCYSQAMYDVIQASQAIDHIFVASAGNNFFGTNNDELPTYPATYDLPNIVSVAATDNDDDKASFSMYGPTAVDLGAPGVNVYSSALGSDYKYLRGTSMAAPHVTGVTALITSLYPAWSWQQVRDWLLLTARPVDSLDGLTVTGGVVNAGAAVGDCNGNGIVDALDIAASTSADCNANNLPDECERDCNGNDVQDDCDISGGFSDDCDGDGVPDDCEPDCNGNGIADDCDVTGGPSEDCNDNGIPDECEIGWNQDCNSNGLTDLCELYLGVSSDCNGNHVPDDCDAGTTSEDCTGNQIPDECERDCDGDGVVDVCQIADDPLLDSDGDGILDSCPLGFYVVPVDATGEHTIQGNRIILYEPGQRVELEIHTTGWDPNMDGGPAIDIYQATVDIASFTSGQAGFLDFARIPCLTDDDCNSSGFSASHCEADGFCDFWSSLYVNESHPDFVFANLPTISLSNSALYWVGSILWEGAVRDPGVNKYAATLFVDVSPDALGTFTIGLVGELDGTWGSFWAESYTLYTPSALVSGFITIPTDCNGNTVPDHEDVLGNTSEDCNGNWYPDECEPDCNGNTVADSCDIANETSADCDGNGIPDDCEPDCNQNTIADACDIAAETSQDCDGNGIPDDCQPDCNQNTIADACDITNETSADCTGNGIPDECEPDCNGNTIADTCDIAAETSEDCDNNMVPDECGPDCNSNDVPDACEIVAGTGKDCNQNAVLDECDIDGAGSSDLNGNGVPDECEAAPPLPEDSLGVTTCTLDTDCANEAYCVPDTAGGFPGTCYVPKNRYLSVAPNPANLYPTARRLSVRLFQRLCDGGTGGTCTRNTECATICDDLPISCADDVACDAVAPGSTCASTGQCVQVVGWLGQPNADGHAAVVDEAGRHHAIWADLTFPIECGVDEACPAGSHCDTGLGASNSCRLDVGGTEVPSTVVHLSGCQIAPKRRDVRPGADENRAANYYLIEAIVEGSDIADPSTYSTPLELRTVEVWGDMTGGTQNGVALPPNAAAGFLDILDQALRFKDKGQATTPWLDLDPQEPDHAVGFLDMLRTVGGFKEEPYPWEDPCTCAGLAPCN